jgi:GT2 family glycosyltransferase/glycosyltransferase involved in cell wall biosynthesis
MPDLSIIILNWNVRELLLECLRALPGAAGEWWSRSEVVVVDNASTDGSVEAVLGEFPDARVLALKRNLGFSGGNNAGIRASRGRLLLLLNPDTLPEPGSIAALCDYMEAHPDVGIAGPRLLNPDGTLQPSRRRFPTLLTGLVESTPLQRLAPDAPLLQRFYMFDRSDDETQDVGWLSGAVLLCRREVLAQAGLFDTGYFMFSEELDLCRRVSRAGWHIVYVPSSRVVHYGGSSTEQDVPSRHIRFNTSKARYFAKHHGPLAGSLMRLYLLGTYAIQALSEAAKLALGHKPALRRTRLRTYAQVLRSGLRAHSSNSAFRIPHSAFRNDVLLIAGEYPPARGGVGDYTCLLGSALARKGVERRVLTTPSPIASNQQPATSHQLPIQSPKLALERSEGSKIQNRSVPLVVPRITLRGVLAALKGTRSRIAHVQYQTGAYAMRPTVNLLPLLLGKMWSGKVVVTFHDLRVPYLFPKAGRAREWANCVMARFAHTAIATNPEDAETLRAWGVSRVETIPIGSNIRNEPPAGYNRIAWRAARGINRETIVISYFGFLNSSKGLDDLLRALHVLRSEGDYRLLMVGGGLGSSDPTNRATAAELDALARDLGVAEQLIWTGYLPPQEVSAALLSADMAVLPYADGASFRRGSLLAILEHGLPLITTEPQSAIQNPKPTIQNQKWPELIHGENALLVAPGDTQALASRIREVSSDPALVERLVAGAHKTSEFFDWGRIADLHIKLYDILQE